MKARKGSAFEREICKRLSLWWSDDTGDDIFWRTSNSGGRATVRAIKGRTTSNQHGDICAIDPIGLAFLKAVTLEIKRGYSRDTVGDLIDTLSYSAKQTYEKWIEQAEASQKGAGSFAWIIIHRRNQRAALVIMPYELWAEIHWPLFVTGTRPIAEVWLEENRRIVCVKLEDFLRVPPERFRQLARLKEKSDADSDKEGGRGNRHQRRRDRSDAGRDL